MGSWGFSLTEYLCYARGMSALIAAVRAWIARNIIDDDPYPFERTGLDLLELNGAPR